MTSSYTAATVKSGVCRLMELGWYNSLSDEEKGRICSYRVKRWLSEAKALAAQRVISELHQD